MQDLKHTQGDWTKEGTNKFGSDSQVVYIRCKEQFIATIHTNEDGKNNEARINESEENAKLIAAAPDLLLALIEVCNDAAILSLGESDNTVKVMVGSINQCVKAIQKATK